MTPPTGLAITGYALVTGAGSGIGRETALAFAKEGAAGVAFADIDIEAAQKAAEESKGDASNPAYQSIVIHIDISKKEDCDDMVDTVVENFGRLDYAANCAGVYVKVFAPLSLIPEDEMNRVMSVNFMGTLFCMQAEIEAMRKQEARPNPWNARRQPERGSIVNVMSVASWFVGPFAAQYAASKHALHAVTKGAAVDHATDLVRVNGVYPAWVDTPMVRGAVAATPEEVQFEQRMKAMVPTAKLALPDEVADAVLWLASPRASYVIGAGITIDAGGGIWPANHHDIV